MKSLTFITILAMAGNVYAQSGADALLEATGTEVEAVVETKTNPMLVVQEAKSKFKITDQFLQSLFVEWKASGNQSFEVNRWVGQVLSHDFIGAAHLWSSVQEHMPENLRPTAKATWAYITWRMNLPQTFVTAWSEARAAGKNSRPFVALEGVLADEKSANWLTTNRPYIDPTFASELITSANEGFALELAAWAARFDFNNAATVLAKIPVGHPRALDLAQTSILNHARKNELGEAGKILKRRMEPELAKIGDSKLLAKHYLTLGRLLYQAGSLEASEAFYAKVPTGVAEFLPARTERTWALLRLGRISELRGELESLSNNVLSDRFLPEVSLVRSISNLKLCRYDDVAQDFKFFIDSNQKWVKKISSALEAQITPNPDVKDSRLINVENALKVRTDENKRLALLSTDSIKAALPAVGEQAHWLRAREQVSVALEADNRSYMTEKRRFWKNREIVLAEAIRKMKFVKVEAMSQLRMAAAEKNQNSDTISTVRAAQGKQSYPFEGVYWPDELFHLHAEAQTRCGGKK